MRRQLFLEDYDVPSFHINVQSSDIGPKRHYGFNTDFQTKQMKTQTNIRSSQTQSVGFQISPSIISQDLNGKINQNKKQNNQIGQLQQNQETIQKLLKFLRKTMPLMQTQLNQNLPLYSRYGTQNDKKYFKKQSRLVHTLQNLDNPSEEKLVVSDISWNSTGVIVAAGYSSCDHDSTCSHKSMICYWGIFKRNFKPTKPQIIYTNNCINCIQFHPKKPSILACGNYIGEVLLYDLSRKDEQLLAKTTVDDYFHRDLITQISWWAFRPPGKSDTNYNILSLGTDGKILLWETSNQSLAQDAPVNRVKMLLKYPLKGFLMLRKKQGNIIPVSGLSMSQSRTNKNIFVVGSQGGSILRATLSPINHHINTEGKVLLDIQQSVKFKTSVYPFMLNLLPKNLRQVKTHIQKIGTAQKIEQVDSVTTILGLKPEIRNLYPNPITFAFQQLSYPISSISSNKYGLFIANGCDGYSRLYSQNLKQNIESFQQGFEWGWIDNGSKIGGFMGQQFTIVDWTTSSIIWSIAVGQAFKWKQSSSNWIAVICQQTKVKIIQLGDKATKEPQNARQLVNQRINELTHQ